MTKKTSSAIARPELVFATVAGVGCRLADLETRLASELADYGYRVSVVSIGELLASGSDVPDDLSYGDRVLALQAEGDKARSEARDGAMLARMAIERIREVRASLTGDADTPADSHAYIVHQLKHPAEVDLLRRVYGPSFHLVAAHASRERRLQEIQKRIATARADRGNEHRYAVQAMQIVDGDEPEDDEFGQNTRDTYPKADLFVDLEGGAGEKELTRYVRLLFGHPFCTPTPHEYAMYQAYSVSLRSSDFSRQVGAAVVQLSRDQLDAKRFSNADIIAVGMNEVPRAAGGFYWDGVSPDKRDQRLLHDDDDRPSALKEAILSELLTRLHELGHLGDAVPPARLAKELVPRLKGTKLFRIGEFQRMVHAEMAALIDAARRGVAVDGKAMFVTTFPCHNCAKHIIASGLAEVVFLEPYPKSKAKDLHGEEIAVDEGERRSGDVRVRFISFAGIGPRRYEQFFSMALRGRTQGDSLKDWEGKLLTLRPAHIPFFIERAQVAAESDALQKSE
ncbi:MAG: hypothetical protein IT357_07765 [Gemmatimonadaceae bacterium]|nr:hypothetical protein [Gemmatimonadaceae bacterium]